MGKSSVPRFEVVGENLEVRVGKAFLTPVSREEVQNGDLLRCTRTTDGQWHYYLVKHVIPTPNGNSLGGIWMKDRRDSGGCSIPVDGEYRAERVRPDVARMVVDYLTTAWHQYLQYLHARHPQTSE